MEKVNECARMIYSNMGYEVEEGYDFEQATHPQEILCYNIAIRTCNFWQDAFEKRD